MQFPLSPSQYDIQVSLVAFLKAILPAGTPVVEGQDNRVAEPGPNDFVVFWTLRRTRLATNVDLYNDAVFTGSIAGNVMTITAVGYGSLSAGSTVFGVGVATGTFVMSQLTGTPGGIGTYSVNLSQTTSSETLAAGVGTYLQETEIDFQLDVHGPSSADNAQTISTLFRDEYAVDFFAAINSSISPLLADDPIQAPFLNDSQQYETRYVVNARVQANQTVTVPQQFMSEVNVEIIEVDAAYPPS